MKITCPHCLHLFETPHVTVQEAAKRGGRATLAKHGMVHYERLAKLGGEAKSKAAKARRAEVNHE